MAFAVLIAILMNVGQLGLRRMGEIDDHLSDIMGKQSTNLQLARRALMLSNSNSRITMRIVLVENRALVDALLAARSENSQEISRLIEESERRCTSEKERQLLSAVKRTRRPYVEIYLRAIHLLVDEGKHDEAEAVMVNQALPALVKYHAAWDEFVEFQKNEVEAAVQQAQVDYVKARRVVSLLIGLAVVLAVVIAIFTTRATAREMAARMEAKNEVAELNATLEMKVAERTRELTDANRQLANEVNARRQAQESYRQETIARESVESELQRSEERMRMAIAAAQIGFWDWDVVKNEQVWSNACKALLGLPAESTADFDVLMNSVHPDDRATMGEEIKKAIEEKRDYALEFRVVWPDKSVHWQAARGRAFYDDAGRTTRMAGITMDIDTRRSAEERLHLQAAALEAAANAVVITDSKGAIVWVNQAFTTMTGYDKEDVMGKNPRLLKSGTQPDSYYAKLWSTISSGKVWRGELVNRRKDGSIYTEEMTITPVNQRVGGKGETQYIAIKQDVTKRRQAEEAMLFKTALLEAQSETTIDGILAVDESDHIVLANKQFGLHFGIPDELLATRDDQKVLQYVMAKIDAPEAFAERVKYLYSHRNEKSRDELRFKDGKIFDRYSAPLTDLNGHYRGRIWYFRDITDRKVAEQRVQFLAYYDALTGLPNRTLLQDRLAKALAGARRHKCKVALLFLDLDRFKAVNDSLGHSVGDLLLQEVAKRLIGWARELDTVARLGGDEFVIVLTNVKDISDVAVATERLIDVLAAEFLVQGHSLVISCSLGISIYPEHGADAETLIKNADAAMYSAKDNGRDNFRFFTGEMNAQAVERLTLENSLRQALEREELFLVYQPQLDITTGRITGLEALLRWQHPGLGLVPPDKFIRIAENSGLIMPIGEWVLRTACTQARRWQDEGLPAVPVAVNVSAVQFRQEGFVALIARVLHETGLAPQYLELELTESLLLSSADVTFLVLQELKAMGLSLAIDDFGTGYSSLSYLKRFPVSRLKIDRSFVRDVAVNPDDAAITSAIISMAKSLKLRVIAEGVENESQMSFLRAHHCDEIQGYYFSKPLAVDKVADKLRGQTPEARVRNHAL